MDWVTSELIMWGQDRQVFYSYTGYSEVSTLARIFEGTTGKPGHRILCADIDKRSWPIEMIVMHLDQIYCDALIAKFALPPNKDGTIFTNRETATRLCLSVDAYKMRVRRGKRIFKRVRKTLDLSPVSGDIIQLSKTAHW